MVTFKIGVSEPLLYTDKPYQVIVEEVEGDGARVFYHGEPHRSRETAESEAAHIGRTLADWLTSVCHYQRIEEGGGR